MVALGDDDFSGSYKAAGGFAGRLHETFPVAAIGFSVGEGDGGADLLSGFGGADGFGFASECAAFGEEGEDGGFEGAIGGAGPVAAAGVAAVFDDVPVLRPLLAVFEGAAAGLADFVAVRGGSFGSGSAVGHGKRSIRCDIGMRV